MTRFRKHKAEVLEMLTSANTTLEFHPFHLDRSLRSRRDRNRALRIREHRVLQRWRRMAGGRREVNADEVLTPENYSLFKRQYERKIRSIGPPITVNIKTIQDVFR